MGKKNLRQKRKDKVAKAAQLESFQVEHAELIKWMENELAATFHCTMEEGTGPTLIRLVVFWMCRSRQQKFMKCVSRWLSCKSSIEAEFECKKFERMLDLLDKGCIELAKAWLV